MKHLADLMSALPVLDRKLVRDLWHIRSQAFAIAVVIGCGVAVFIMSIGMIRSLELTRTAYYERYRFADIYASAARAPEYLVERIQKIEGIKVAESRITVEVILDVPGAIEPITGRIHSLPPSGEPRLNMVVLRTGRMIDPRRNDEVLVSEAFALERGLLPGDSLYANLKGKKRKLKIVGLVLSPEYVYAMAPGQLLPDNSRFGVLWMAREHLAAAFDLDGAFNEVVASLNRGANEEEVIRRIDLILDDYGGIGAYGRSEQISDLFLTNEMDQLQTMTAILPPIFLAVAAFLLNVVLSRLIETEWEQIGLLKAFGYSRVAIGWHYTKLVLAMTSVGIVLGYIFGTWLGGGLARIYTDFFVFPFLYFQAGFDIYVWAALITFASALAGTVYSVVKVVRLPPAVAMRPPAPVTYSGTLIRWLTRVRWLDEPSRMVARHLLRSRMRAILSIIGIALALGLRIGTEATNDSVDRMVELTFDYVERQSATILLSDPRAGGAIHAIDRLPGVLKAEPFRTVPAKLRFGSAEERQALTGIVHNAELNRLIDQQERPVDPPPFGLILSTALAQKLKIVIGDSLTIEVMEGRRPTLHVRVTALADVYIGTPAYMHIDELNRAMQEGDVISGAYLMTDPREITQLYGEVKETPLVAGLTLRTAALETFSKTLEENMTTMIFFNTLFATLIVIGVVYNNARISLSERARDLASLRVLGFRRSEVSYILLLELAVLTVAAIPLGILLGMLLAWYIATTFSTDLFTIPYALERSTIAIGVITVGLAAIGSALIVRHRIDNLDLIRVLKTRE